MGEVGWEGKGGVRGECPPPKNLECCRFDSEVKNDLKHSQIMKET